ncbi:hypothetical protein EX895_002071 [Sporisorium graminicola]|uniref:Uncharacterized protein n=1 Tax=Sporisorium graminicola TaxID=280036 RepID=A0A4U7KWG3_9BASI|nr:hypothetical protein EX895_002071 [Sporisorium graminicola]TKY88830.1 hypothetical protein EX895_002071 [Sporisorium graminicola]
MTSPYYPSAAPYVGQEHAAPPSYDAAMGSASTPRSSRTQRLSDEKQYRGFTEKEQHRRQQEFASYPSRPSSSNRYASSTPAQLQASPSSSRSGYGGMPLNPQTALAQFGSPFATSADWAPSAHDARLTHLPQVDLETRIKMRFSGPSAEQRALAPPPSFSRHCQPTLRYSAHSHFEPVYIKSANKKEEKKQLLSDGFQPVYPGALMVQHNVSAADWGRFLEDLAVAGKLTGKQSIISNVAPMTMHMGATGFLVTRAIERAMKKRKDPVICEAVETWQQSFFGPRDLDVYILHTGERLTARSPNAPIPGTNLTASTQLQRSKTSASSSSSSSSSSSDSDDSVDSRHPAFQPTGDRKMDKMQKKALKKQRRLERKQRKAQHKHEKKMARIDRKRERDLKKHGDSASRTGARGGYLLVIAPLKPTVSKPPTDAAAFMW